MNPPLRLYPRRFVNRNMLAVAAMLTAMCPSGKVFAQSVWNGAGSNNNWSTGANWASGTAPASATTTDVQISGNTRLTPNVDTPYTIKTLIFNSGAGAFTVGGSTLSIQGFGSQFSNAVINNSSATETIQNNITMLSAFAFSAAQGNLILGGGINLNGVAGASFLAASGKTLTLNGVISGSSTATIGLYGGGTIAVNGTNTYTAGTKISFATVIVGTNVSSSAGAFGNVSGLADQQLYLGDTSGSGTTSLLTGGAYTIDRAIRIYSNTNYTLTIGGNTADTSTFSQIIRLGDDSGGAAMGLTLTAASGGTVNIDGALSRRSGATGSGDIITKTGLGTVVLSNTTSNYTGATIVKAGVLSVGYLANGGVNSNIGASSSAATSLVLNGGTLRYTGTAVTTNRLFSVGTANGSIEANGSGPVVLSGTGEIGYNGQSGSRTLTLSGANTGSNTLAATIGDNGGMTNVAKSGVGRWILSGSSSYTGGTTITAGTLVIAANKSAGSGEVTLAGGALQVNSGVTITNAVKFTSGSSSYKLVRATGDSYSAYSSQSQIGGIITAAALRGGTVSASAGTETLTTSFLTSDGIATNDSIRLSDIFSLSGMTVLSGTQTDTFALQLSVSNGITASSFVAWLDGSNSWTNAVSGNTGAGVYAGFYNLSYDAFIASHGGVFDATTMLGAYGSDGTGSVWSVLNHNSEFAAVPEPKTMLLLGCGCFAILVRLKSRKV